MIHHIVMFKIKEDLNKEEAIQAIKNALEALPSVISEIKYFEVNINTIHSERSMDLILNSKFDSFEDLSIYQKHPEHQKVVSLIKSLTSESRVVDY